MDDSFFSCALLQLFDEFDNLLRVMRFGAFGELVMFDDFLIIVLFW